MKPIPVFLISPRPIGLAHGHPPRGWSCIILAIGLIITMAACTHPVRRLVFQPHKIAHVPAFPNNINGLKRFWITTEQGAVEGWIMGGLDQTSQHPGPAVMIAHGNRELIDHYLDHAAFYRDLGFTVLMGEYRGYGRSAGKPSRKRIRDDAIQFYDKLAAMPGVDPRRIMFHGRSLGGAVLADLAQYRRPAAIILESTFQSIKAMAHGAPNFLLSDRYDTAAALRNYKGPILILHGRLDQVVPVQHAYDLKAQISQAELIVGDFGHNNAISDRFDYWGALNIYIGRLNILNP